MNRWPLVSDQFPFLRLTVGIASDRLEVEALVDTGFDGDIVLPARQALPSGLEYDLLVFRLADGTRVRVPTFRAAAVIGAVRIRPVDVVLVGGVPMVGRRLIRHFSVTLDHGRRVIVEP
jgi:predicted aspartyl protease